VLFNNYSIFGQFGFLSELRNKASDINKRTKEGSCSKTTNSSLIMKFNESSKNIFDNIADFIWFITRDGKNYDPKVEPYVGCSSNCKKYTRLLI